jgi:hypothetical protein
LKQSFQVMQMGVVLLAGFFGQRGELRTASRSALQC